jgi:hypothetical protein
MIRMNWAEFRFVVWARKKNLNTTYTLDTDDAGNKYYEIVSAEPDGGMTYFVRINSIDDSDDIDTFEQEYLFKCNQRINQPGMAQDVQALMIKHLEGIEKELKLLNRRIEYGFESGTGHSDGEDD